MYDVNSVIEDVDLIVEEGINLEFELKCHYKLGEEVFKAQRLSDYDYYKSYTLDIYAGSLDISVKVGELTFKIFDIWKINYYGEEKINIFDSIDQDSYEIGKVLELNDKLKEVYDDCSKVLYIERLFINKSIRNNGIAHNIMENFDSIIDCYLEITPEIVIFKSYPIESKVAKLEGVSKVEKLEKIKEQQTNLNKLYLECGFNMITMREDYYFYRIMGY